MLLERRNLSMTEGSSLLMAILGLFSESQRIERALLNAAATGKTQQTRSHYHQLTEPYLDFLLGLFVTCHYIREWAKDQAVAVTQQTPGTQNETVWDDESCPELLR